MRYGQEVSSSATITVVALPNLLPALTARMRTFPEVMALTQGRITAGRLRTLSKNDPSGWEMPTYGLVFADVGGPGWSQGRAPVRAQSVQLTAYGPDLRTADLLYRTVLPLLVPTDNYRPTGFIAAGVAVISIEELGTPVGLYQVGVDWPRSAGTLWIKYSSVPANQTSGSAELQATAS